MTYCPQQGDIVWLSFVPQAGREQAGHRPALTLTPDAYNRKVGLALFCPLTSRSKGYPFEVLLPGDLKVTGVVLSDQVKSLDWRARNVKFACKAPAAVMAGVLGRIEALLCL